MNTPRAMRWLLPTLTVVGSLLTPAPGVPLSVSAQGSSARGISIGDAQIVPGEIVVKFRSTVSGTQAGQILEHVGVRPAASAPTLGIDLLRAEPGGEAAAIGRLRADPRVAYAEPNYRVRAFDVPGDPLYPAQWALPRIGMEQAWPISTGSGSVTVAVVDTGVSLSHPELDSRVISLSGPGPPAADHVFLSSPSPACPEVTSPDDDGWQAPSSPLSHGTHVAGIIASESTLSGHPSVGIAGIAPSVRIAPLKALDCAGSGSSFDTVRAIAFAAEHGASVINLSLGTAGSVPACPLQYVDAIALAHARGSLLVAAAGNDGTTNLSVPAVCNHVVGVGATNQQNAVPPFSQRNNTVDLAAPGVDILSTIRSASGQFGYETSSGTSMATPHVAGCAALVRSVKPALSPDEVEALLRTTANDLGPPGPDDSYGSGLLRCGAALAAASGLPNGEPQVTSLGLRLSPGNLTLLWTPGVVQSGYLGVRLLGGSAAVLPPGPLPANASSLVDTMAAPGSIPCYAVIPTSGTAPSLGQPSNLVCAALGTGSAAGGPLSFTVRPSPEGQLTASWESPLGGGQDGYLLLAFPTGSAPVVQNLPGQVVSTTAAIEGLTCYWLITLKGGIVLGYSDLLCATLPGQ